MLVGFGQLICLPIGPKCESCLVGQTDGLCPSKKLVKTKKKKSNTKTFKEAEEEEQGVSEAKVKIEVEEDKKDGNVEGKVKVEELDTRAGVECGQVELGLVKKEEVVDDW